MTGWTPKPWLMPLLEWTPELLPGYAETVAKLKRGEPLFPPQVKRPPRPRRPVTELIAQRERLQTELDKFNSTEPVDTAAARLNRAGMRTHYKHTDTQLAGYVALTKRIEELTSKIARHPDT